MKIPQHNRIKLAPGIIILGFGIWVLTPILSVHAHRITGYEYLQQALEILGDQNPAPDYCVSGGISDPKALEMVKKAVQVLEEGREIKSRDSQTLLFLGRGYCLLGRVDKAVEVYEKYTQLRPENPVGHLELGFAYDKLDLKDAAIKEWHFGGITARRFLEKGNEIEAHKGIASALTSTLVWYERAALVSPQSPQAWLQIGLTNKALNNEQKTLNALETAWQIDKELATAEYAKALQIYHFDEKAEKILRQSLNEFSDSENRYEWWTLLGTILETMEKWELAIEVYQAASREFPIDINFAIALGWSYYNVNHLDQGFNLAKIQFENAISLNDQIGRGYFAMGELLRIETQYKEADKWFQEAILRSPNAQGWYLARGNNARLANNLSLALEIYLETIQRFPDNAQPYFEIAWAYYLVGQTENAIQAIEYAIEISDIPRAGYYLRAGNIYAGTEHNLEARNAYEQVLILDPENKAAKDGLLRLDNISPIFQPLPVNKIGQTIF